MLVPRTTSKVVRNTYLNFYFRCPAPKIKVNGIELSGEVIPLQHNILWIDRFPETLYVYHCFKYRDTHGNLLEGRWSSRSVPIEAFKTMKRLFRRQVTDDSGQTAIIRLIFTEKVAVELRALN